MNPANCEFVMIGGLWLPAVAGIERTPVYIGDYERAVSGVLRTAHVGKAMEWRVLLQGVAGEDVEALEEVLRSPVPVGCNIMGTEVIASVTELSSSHAPKRHGPDADWGRMNYEILVREVVVENIMPGFTYEYVAFTDVGSFVWDWDAAGQPDEVDVLLVAGGGGGGNGGSAAFGYGGGGAGGVRVITDFPVSGNVSGSVGAGGAAGTNGSDSVFGAQSATGGGAGANSANGSAGGSGGGSRESGAPGAGTSGQGHAGGQGNAGSGSSGTAGSSGGAGGGGGGGGPGGAGGARDPFNNYGGSGGSGGTGLDLLSLGWNYRLAAGAPRYVAGGGGGSGGHRTATGGMPAVGGAPGAGGVGGGGQSGRSPSTNAQDGQPNTGGGGGAGAGSGAAAGTGGSGLVIVRWLVNP